MKILAKYQSLCNTSSDINELLPLLALYASRCSHITEMGVRGVVSTYAFLATRPDKLISYDIGTHPNVLECAEQCVRENQHWQFIEADVLNVSIEPTDFLFIDTFHTASQLQSELHLHADKVKKFIAFHDTTTYWEKGEDSYEAVAHNQKNCGRGLRHAIEPFLAAHPEWQLELRAYNNNGLSIISRK